MQAFQSKITLNCSGQLLDISNPLVMGILNITPDSFYEVSRVTQIDDILKRARLMLEEGAAILDIGAQSTRPGSNQLSANEEWKRLNCIIPELVKAFPEAIFSIDTYHAKVAELSIQSGFHIVNDVSAFDDDPDMFPFLREAKVPYIMMHKKGDILSMQKNPTYKNVLVEILDYFSLKVSMLRDVGLTDFIIDPGFGFGKTIQHNLQILKNLNSFSIFNLPILVGLSRKKMLRDIGAVKVEDALNLTSSANTIALMNGAKILRVHDVKEAIECIKIYNAVKYI